jgi:hypothetical protein
MRDELIEMPYNLKKHGRTNLLIFVGCIRLTSDTA